MFDNESIKHDLPAYNILLYKCNKCGDFKK